MVDGGEWWRCDDGEWMVMTRSVWEWEWPRGVGVATSHVIFPHSVMTNQIYDD